MIQFEFEIFIGGISNLSDVEALSEGDHTKRSIGLKLPLFLRFFLLLPVRLPLRRLRLLRKRATATETAPSESRMSMMDELFSNKIDPLGEFIFENILKQN